MNRRQTLLGVSALGLGAVLDPAAARAASALGGVPTRNVLLIDLDDIGRAFLRAAMASGGAPNLQRAFEAGRSYSAFWAAPNCSVFRARLLTGLDAYRLGNRVGRIVQSTDVSFDGPTGLWLPSGLPGRKVKLGKWHCSGAATFPARLITGGYDDFVGTRGNLDEDGGTYYTWTEWFADAQGTSSALQTQFATTRVAQLALAELALGSELVHVSFHAIHKPLTQPPDGEPAGHVYSGTSEDELKANLLFHLDHWLGRLLERAFERGYVAIVACDNGTDGEGKGTYYESGIDTPLVVVGHGVKPGASARLVQATDLWATVRRLRGDSSGATAADGFDFSDDCLSLPPVTAPRQYLTVDWFPYLGVAPPANKWSRAIRDARWKYVDQKLPPNGMLPAPVVGLWDLQSDPDEQVNLLDFPLTPEADAALTDLLANLP